MTPLDWQVNDQYDSPESLLGPIPLCIDADSSDPVWLQFDLTVGWNPHLTPAGFDLHADNALTFHGLPPAMPVAQAVHLGERVLVYPAGWVVILQLDGRYSIARIVL